MSLFPSIGVAGHSAEDGLNPDGGALQKAIGKNLFKESDRGAPFRRKLASVLERVRSPVRMPRLNRSDREMFYPLSVVVKDVDFEFVTASPAAHVPQHVRLQRDEVYQNNNNPNHITACLGDTAALTLSCVPPGQGEGYRESAPGQGP